MTIRTTLKHIAPWLKIAAYLAAIPMLILLVRAFDARSMPDLHPWHRIRLEHEFFAAMATPGFDFEDYAKLEQDLFAELDRVVYAPTAGPQHQPFNRYFPNSRSDPRHMGRNWNRSFEMVPDRVRGGVLLLHGLTDSPYSMRSVAQIYRDQGYYVLCPRLPGHGTIPASLLTIHWEDWTTAVTIAAEHVTRKIGPDRPFNVVGYSNGGSLALRYVFDAVEGSGQRVPDKMVLLSPALGVTHFAGVADWHKILSFLPYFEKFKWESIALEFDPFKYNSFPKNAGDQIHLLAKSVQHQIRRITKGSIKKLPPILTFQSVVDSTVNSDDVVDKLYRYLKPNGSELVLFDVNRCAQLAGFIRSGARTILPRLERNDALPYRLTVVTNATDDVLEVVARSRPPTSDFEPSLPLKMSWPMQVYSLSHVAIPFPPDDPLYGNGLSDPQRVQIGALEPRGERNLLSISADQLLRLRHNPFFGYVHTRVIEWITHTD